MGNLVLLVQQLLLCIQLHPQALLKHFVLCVIWFQPEQILTAPIMYFFLLFSVLLLLVGGGFPFFVSFISMSCI